MTAAETGKLSEQIRRKARELDFDICGIAESRKLSERTEVLKKWVEEGMHDRMGYLERNTEKREDPQLLFPGTRSLVVVGFSYYSELKQKDPTAPLLSRYTYGTNYHDVIEKKLEKLLDFVKEKVPGCEGKAFVDSDPLFEKGWAQEAGLGWQGKHSIVISKEIGSFFFIGVLMLNIDLEYDKPYIKDYCGECRLCIEACPTGAINSNRTIDARKCISNLTIGNRGPIPEEIIPKLGGRIYACDRCQEVCPWNQNAPLNSHPEFAIDERIARLTREDWQSLTEDQFKLLFGNTSMERIKFADLKRNISAAIRSMD
ncbi:MAG: tRNA epoxyqueuosine(34) reductase QueG [Bacteroidales bacterium]|jgi:epoxyqueuosine reductase|nr:tRNA epoxyqueuosine(34) reductase QueG [Bacteroidales bacterium]